MLRSLLFLVFFLQVFDAGVMAAQRCYGEGEKLRPKATVAELIQDLDSDYWPRVWTAELRLESREADSIPSLIKLAKNSSRVKLRETWDLIYPGATTFYGHGYIVDYDLDSLSARAGWALEKLTFQNFGFSEGMIDHDMMFNATVAGEADKPLGEVVNLNRDPKVKQKLQEAAAQRAENWWKESAESWSRKKALIEALTSRDSLRAEWAMNYVRNGETRCSGFTPDFLKTEVLEVKNEKIAKELDEFRNWLIEMEKEKKDAFFYKSKSEDACF
jgi:hypothetical protein